MLEIDFVATSIGPQRSVDVTWNPSTTPAVTHT
jgi:hypothetical protein